MKKLILFLCIIPFLTYAQKSTPEFIASNYYPVKDGALVYEKIVDGVDIKKEKLFAVSKKWLADNFKSAKAVIQTEDITTGQIIGRGIGTVVYSQGSVFVSSQDFKYSIQIDAKDGKYRIRIYDILFYFAPSSLFPSGYEKPMDDVLGTTKKITGKNKVEKAEMAANSINKYFNGLIESFHNSIVKSKEDTF